MAVTMGCFSPNATDLGRLDAAKLPLCRSDLGAARSSMARAQQWRAECGEARPHEARPIVDEKAGGTAS